MKNGKHGAIAEAWMSNFVVRVTSHFCGRAFNVDLVRWERGGSGMKVCKAFNVSREEADKEALRVAELYDATVERYKHDQTLA
jgi:hypothetical protein